MTVTAIVDALVPRGRRDRPGIAITPGSVTIHNTANPGQGANARAHARALVSGNLMTPYLRSWHYTVDDVSIYRHIPHDELAYHAGTGAGNSSSVGVEICENADLNVPAAYDNAAWLAATLLRQIGKTPANGLRQHHDWSGKNCPAVLRGSANGWSRFIAAVQVHFSRSGQESAMLEAVPAKPVPKGRAKPGLMAADRVMICAIAEAAEHHRGIDASMAPAAAPVPPEDPVPFAVLAPGPCFWPVASRHAGAHGVPADLADGTSQGAPGRRFLASRLGGGRYHVGVDLAANEGDDVLAIQDGKIVAFYPFYARPNGDETWALFVAHDGCAVNYGEVLPDSLTALGLSVGDRVSGGQRIGRVSGTRMVHFETYKPGTTSNKRWLPGGARPAALRNPTQLLLDIQASGTLIGPAGDAFAGRGPGAASLETPDLTAEIPHPVDTGWHRHFEFGREWRYDARGVHTHDVGNGAQPWRWESNLLTMRRIWAKMGPEVVAASARHGVNPALILMTIAAETHFAALEHFTGPKTFRWEAHVPNEDVSPVFRGDYSAGPMQTLATTARWVIRSKGAQYGLAYDPFTVAPAFRQKPDPKPPQHPLYDYAANIDIGTAEIRIRLDKTGDDPILVAAAFNAGGVYPKQDSDWGIRAQGDHLDRAAKWYGDACMHLTNIGVF
jgi:murein DD-endopeptidase MepM/ murein hydrolase activator NlpD